MVENVDAIVQQLRMLRMAVGGLRREKDLDYYGDSAAESVMSAIGAAIENLGTVKEQLEVV